jgi:cysteinyl-tRNA synthetase
MGERRLRILEAQLPPDTFVLGVDEHTGVSFDLDTQVVRVFGRGTMTVRKGDHVWQVKSGEETTIDEIAKQGGVERVIAETTEPLFIAADQVDELLDTGNVLAAVDALLELDEMDRDIDTRATVHALITRLGQLAASPRVDLQSVVGPYIEALLQARNAARTGGRWDEADAIRDQLTSLHVTIKDTSDGSQWDIHSS